MESPVAMFFTRSGNLRYSSSICPGNGAFFMTFQGFNFCGLRISCSRAAVIASCSFLSIPTPKKIFTIRIFFLTVCEKSCIFVLKIYVIIYIHKYLTERYEMQSKKSIVSGKMPFTCILPVELYHKLREKSREMNCSMTEIIITSLRSFLG